MLMYYVGTIIRNKSIQPALFGKIDKAIRNLDQIANSISLKLKEELIDSSLSVDECLERVEEGELRNNIKPSVLGV